MNTLRERPDSLAEMDHCVLLDEVIRVLEARGVPFFCQAPKPDGRLVLNADGVARAVAAKRWNERDVVTRPGRGRPTTCTLHMPVERVEGMRQRLHTIERQLRTQWEEVTGPEARAATAQRFMGPAQATSPFGRLAPHAHSELNAKRSAERRRLTFVRAAERPGAADAAGSSDPLMRLHRLAITVKVSSDLRREITEGLRAYFAQHPAYSDSDRAQIELLIGGTETHHQIEQLALVLETETIGQIKKFAARCYWEFSCELLPNGDPARMLVQTLLARLARLEQFLEDPSRADEEYEVSYKGIRCNLRTLFAQADAYSELPVGPVIQGVIGETTDLERDERTYVMGVKLKLNGRVAQYDSPSSFDYHLAKLRGEFRDRHQYRPETLIRLAVLYHVAFDQLDTHGHDPVATLDSDFLQRMRVEGERDPTGAAVDELLRAVASRCALASRTVRSLAQRLRAAQRSARRAPSRTWAAQIGVHGGIVRQSRREVVTDGWLLKDVFASDRKDYLRYVSVTEPRVSDHLVLKLRSQVVLEDIHCFGADQTTETCVVAYDAADAMVLPVLLSTAAGLPPRRTGGKLDEAAAKPGVLVVAYEGDSQTNSRPLYNQPARWFVYRYVFAALAYVGLRLLASLGPDGVLVTLVRSHVREEIDSTGNDPDAFLAGLGKALAHVLGRDYAANSQGIHLSSPQSGRVRDSLPVPVHVIRNAAASLYAPLRKRFRFPQPVPSTIPRLAIVAVSSRECDGARGIPDAESSRRLTVYGHVTELARQDEHIVSVRRLSCFAGTYERSELYECPHALIDQVHRLYAAGHRHIMYVAQAPYSSFLHATRSAAPGDGLFFLSRQIIQECVRDKPDLHLYPVFRDQYYAMKVGPLGANALYVQDTQELMRVVDDPSPSRQMVVFLNLFSGVSSVSGSEDDGKYHGVVSYATLLNSYGGALSDRDLRGALIHDRDTDGHPNALKGALVLYLTLFHFSRYEVSRNQLALKLDPYSEVIGSDSTGAHAVGPHITPAMRFNFLSFLNEVRNSVLGVAS